MRRSSFFVAASAVLFVGSLAGCTSVDTEPVASGGEALARGEVLYYPMGKPIDTSGFVDLGPPESLGGTVLKGDPHLSARIDFSDGSLLAGVFQATRGRVRVHFPFTEHATISYGEVTITDESGHPRVLHPGDSYLVHQGSTVVWDVRCDRVQKSFLSRVEAVDSPGPMRVYRKGSVVPAADLVDLGPPEALGGTVISGDPHIAARIDDAGDGMTAGVFQASRGEVLVHYPFTEHAAVTRWTVDLTGEDGEVISMRPGDAYLILQGSDVLWQVAPLRVQKSFLNFTTW